MTRNREKRALYEVMSKSTWPKPRYDKTLEPLHPGEPDEDKQPATKFLPRMRGRTAKWLNRPRIVQFNAGRIEISMPYQIAIALLLGLVLLVLVVFRLGQITYRSSLKATGSSAQTSADVPAGAQRVIQAEDKASVSPITQKVGPFKSQGDNRIVIQTYQLRADLEPVRQYFARFGVETELVKISDWYYLVTRDKYENPEKPGTDGYLAKQKIIELGAKYKAPQGYETFGSKPFSDAYGKKFND